MWGALFFWFLAVYGAWMLIRSGVTALRKRKSQLEMTFLLITQDTETEVEGVVRSLVMKTAMWQCKRKIVVMDVQSSDETLSILYRLQREYGCLEVIPVAEGNDLIQAISQLGTRINSISCLLDLRDELVLHHFLREPALFH